MCDDETSFNQETPAQSSESSTKWTDNATSQKVISSLEKFVLNQSLDKSYKKIATDGIASSKRTLESLLARNGGHQSRIVGEPTADQLNNKNYTLDANGRVCLVKSNSKEHSRHQELLLLQKDTHELRCLHEYLILAFEALMQNHRQMMVNYVKKVNTQPRQVSQTAIDAALKKANTRIVEDFAQMTMAVDESIAREELRSENRRKLKKSVEMETFLMRMMLEMEDIREANVEDLVRLWKSHERPSAKQPTNLSAGDSPS